MAPLSHTAFIGLGSNLDDPERQVREAARRISNHLDIQISAQSSLYRTAPQGIENQPWFVNAVLKIQTSLRPRPLLNQLLDIEQDQGRTRNITWGPRIIDLDLLFYEDLILNENGLSLPHPEIPNRSFVLEPLKEIAADWVHPERQLTIVELCDQVPAGQEVQRLSSLDP